MMHRKALADMLAARITFPILTTDDDEPHALPAATTVGIRSTNPVGSVLSRKRGASVLTAALRGAIGSRVIAAQLPGLPIERRAAMNTGALDWINIPVVIASCTHPFGRGTEFVGIRFRRWAQFIHDVNASLTQARARAVFLPFPLCLRNHHRGPADRARLWLGVRRNHTRSIPAFGGAGTTGLVADRLGRDAILIELSPEYAALARRRITADAPLFASVESDRELTHAIQRGIPVYGSAGDLP